MKLQELRAMIANRLKEAGVESYDYETWVLLDWKLGINRADYYMDPMKELPSEDIQALLEAVSRREQRVPLQYIMKVCDFMGYDFYVDESVLIPRQDTECLVEAALSFLKEYGRDRKVRVLDLCTGSGCIGISLKLLYPQAQVVLSDLSEAAIKVARHNAKELQADVTILQGDLFHSLESLGDGEDVFDLIVSNPPYIPTKIVEGLMPEVRDYEPHMALDGLEDGLFFYRKITKEAAAHLRAGGGLYYEIGAEQGADVAALLKEAGFQTVFVEKDLASLDRIVRGRLS